MSVWVVTAHPLYRQSVTESYIVGVFNCESIARYAAQVEEEFTNNRYYCEYSDWELKDRVSEDKLERYLENKKQSNLQEDEESD